MAPDRLSEAEYDERAQQELLAMRDAFDALGDDDVEAELQGGILTVEFEDDDQYVVNSHQAARQIWMAAGRQAWHFDWSADRAAWIATRTGDELWSALERALTAKLSRPVRLRPPR